MTIIRAHGAIAPVVAENPTVLPVFAGSYVSVSSGYGADPRYDHGYAPNSHETGVMVTPSVMSARTKYEGPSPRRMRRGPTPIYASARQRAQEMQTRFDSLGPAGSRTTLEAVMPPRSGPGGRVYLRNTPAISVMETLDASREGRAVRPSPLPLPVGAPGPATTIAQQPSRLPALPLTPEAGPSSTSTSADVYGDGGAVDFYAESGGVSASVQSPNTPAAAPVGREGDSRAPLATISRKKLYLGALIFGAVAGAAALAMDRR